MMTDERRQIMLICFKDIHQWVRLIDFLAHFCQCRTRGLKATIDYFNDQDRPDAVGYHDTNPPIPAD
jgi:hypothetical protein